MKSYRLKIITKIMWSPPSRGAWIEIFLPVYQCRGSGVAPLAGGVD